MKIRESDRLGVNMMNTVKEKWPEIIEHLRVEHELSNVSFNTWIQPLKVYDVVDNTVFILVNMNASVEYIEKKISASIKGMHCGDYRN